VTTALDLLQAVAGFTRSQDTGSATRPVKLGTINPAHTTGLPRVTFDGETTLSGKGYPYAASYTPAANDRVALLPVGTTYLIICKVIAT